MVKAKVILKWELQLVSFRLLKCFYFFIVSLFVYFLLPIFVGVFSFSVNYLRSGTFHYSTQELFMEHILCHSSVQGVGLHNWGTEDLSVPSKACMLNGNTGHVSRWFCQMSNDHREARNLCVTHFGVSVYVQDYR